MADPKTAAELTAASQQDLIEFLRADLAMCSTFVEVAKTELFMENRAAAVGAFNKAEHGYDVIQHFAPRIHDPAQKAEIEQGLASLRSRLDSLRGRDDSSPADLPIRQ